MNGRVGKFCSIVWHNLGHSNWKEGECNSIISLRGRDRDVFHYVELVACRQHWIITSHFCSGSEFLAGTRNF